MPRRQTPTPACRAKAVGREAELAYTGHLLMEDRHGLVVDARLTLATGTAEPQATCDMVGNLPAGGRITLSADKVYDTAAFVVRMRELGVTPHVEQNINAHRGSNINARITRHAGHAVSQVVRKRIEEANGWIKCVAVMEQNRHRGLTRVGRMFQFKAAGYNLIRLPKLVPIG